MYENVSLDDPTPADKLPCYGFTLIRPIEGGVFPVGFEQELRRVGWTNRVAVQRTEAALLNLLTGITIAVIGADGQRNYRSLIRMSFWDITLRAWIMGFYCTG